MSQTPLKNMTRIIDFSVLDLQLVQFLLKQAGVDKRTGDLYGNRDLLNIARNMARGLKVYMENSIIMFSSFILLLKHEPLHAHSLFSQLL